MRICKGFDALISPVGGRHLLPDQAWRGRQEAQLGVQGRDSEGSAGGRPAPTLHWPAEGGGGQRIPRRRQPHSRPQEDQQDSWLARL